MADTKYLIISGTEFEVDKERIVAMVIASADTLKQAVAKVVENGMVNMKIYKLIDWEAIEK